MSFPLLDVSLKQIKMVITYNTRIQTHLIIIKTCAHNIRHESFKWACKFMHVHINPAKFNAR